MVPFEEAMQIAHVVYKLLEPHCDRIMIAGSLRRYKPAVKDIEIVCIPKGCVMEYTTQADFFGAQETSHRITKPSKGFIDAVSQFHKIKGEPTGRYTQRRLNEKIVLDLFMCTADNWGYILAVRTGSADYSHKVLGSRWVAKGYKGTNGMLYKNGSPVKVLQEEDLFTLCGMKYIDPKMRNI